MPPVEPAQPAFRAGRSGEHNEVSGVSKPIYHVALALVHDGPRWLVARRLPHAHLGGLWEFPGGKCGPGETAVEAALRELREECGVEAEAQCELAGRSCEYEDRIVHLAPVVCRWTRGTPRPLGSAECRWVTTAELAALEMPAVNADLVHQAVTWVQAVGGA